VYAGATDQEKQQRARGEKMPYTIFTGNNSNNTFFITGVTQFYNQTFTNAYSGQTVTITGEKNVNNAIYDGQGGSDTLAMTDAGDVVTLKDANGTVMLISVEMFNAGPGGDVIILADATLNYGNVTLRGADGDDVLWSNNGNDLIQASTGNDILDGGGGTDRLFGGTGNDYLSGGLGNDTLAGGEGNDTLIYNADAIWGNQSLSFFQTFAPYASEINLNGLSRSHDSFHGDLNDFSEVSETGIDTLVMTSGGDALIIADGISPSGLTSPRVQYMDIIEAGGGDDVIDLSGLPHQAVTINGGTGNDSISATANNDTINGGDGNDRIYGHLGNDALAGGTGNDAYYYNAGNGNDTIQESSGTDRIVFGAGITFASLTFTVSGQDLILGVGGQTITIQNHFAADLSGRVESIQFNDGSTYNLGAYTPPAPPIANDDTFSGLEDQPITGNVLTNDTDANGDTLTAQAGTYATAQGGSVTVNADGTFSYQGATNFNGTDNFSYTVLDGNSGSDTGSVSLNIAAVNDAPVANDDVFSGSEDQIITGNLLLNDSDVDGDMLTAQAGTYATAQGGSVTVNTDGTFSYLGTANFNGTDSFNYTISDNNGGQSAANVTLNVAAVNDAPVANNDVFSGNEDQIITGNVLLNDTDVDGDILTVQAGTYATAQGGAVTLNADGTFSYSGAADFNGTDSFDYTVSDGNGAQSTASVTLNVAAVNDAPVANDDSFSGGEDEVITGNLLLNDTDVDGDMLTAQAGTYATAQGGSVTVNADGTFSYTGLENFNGIDSFDYTVLDGNGGSAAANVTLNISAANDAPAANGDAFSGNEDEVITGNVLLNDTDVDGDVLAVDPGTYNTAQGGTVTLNANGTFSYQGAANFNGNDSFEYTVRDTGGLTSVAQVAIAVAAVNDAPVANDDAFSGFRGAAITGNVLLNDTDIDGDTLFAQPQTIVTAQGGSVTLNADGSFSYTGDNYFFGTDSFDYTVLDGNGGADTATVTLNVSLDPSESIIGTSGNDNIDGTANDDEIFALQGNDTVRGQNGDDVIFGNEDNDVLYGDDGILTGGVQDKAFSDTVIIPELKERVNIKDLRPSGVPALGVKDGNLSVDYDATATITFRKGYAGYDNSFGAFAIAEDGTIVNASIAFRNVKTAGIDTPQQIDIPVGANGGDFGFFIISNGNNVNQGYGNLNVSGEGNIHFIYNYGKPGQREAKITDDGKKISIVYNDGVTVKVLKGDAYFTTDRGESSALNKDGKVHVVSGLRDMNNLILDIKKSDLATSPKKITKNGITLEALTGTLADGSGDRVGIKSSTAGGNIISGNEALKATFAGSEKVVVSLSDIEGGNKGIDFRIYLNGDMTHPISYEYMTGSNAAGGKLDIVLDSSMFGGGLITGFDISSVANSSKGTETFYLDNIVAFVPGGEDTNQIRIGFEDLPGTGDADYEDVLFDLDINPVTVGDTQGGNDYLDGGAGNDVLYGEGGNDILVIGDGRDTATGGAGADTFAVTMIDGQRDMIADFHLAEGDVINVTDVLEGYDPLSDNIANFVRLVQVGSDTELQINADGAGSDFVAAALIVGGAGADLSTLLADGALVANQSVTV
jgi:Ca2+-binding RTX toxin-like protein